MPAPTPTSRPDDASPDTRQPSSAVLTVPNVFTVARLLVLTPLVVWLLVDPDTRVAATIALVVFSGTDWIDGFLARRLGQVSTVGMWLDPIADRLGVAWILVAMLVLGIVPWWVVGTIVVVDAAILIVGWGRRDRIEHMSVVRLGKVRTAVLMVGLPAAALGASTLAAAPTIAVVATVLLAVGAVLHVAAGIGYLRALVRPVPNGT